MAPEYLWATETIETLIENRDIGSPTIDQICKNDQVLQSDLINAIRIGCDFWIANEILKQGLYMRYMRNRMKDWYEKHQEDMGSFSKPQLFEYFRDLFTLTEMLQGYVNAHDTEDHRTELLHGRSRQNDSSNLQLDDILKLIHFMI